MVAVRKAKPGNDKAGARGGSADPLSRDEISSYLLMDEKRLVGGLIERAVYTADERRRAGEIARRLVHTARSKLASHGGIDAFLLEYGLSSEEGVMLMCLAESLLRIPDKETADALIADKIAGGRWERHLGASDSVFVNASTWGLLLTGRIVKLKDPKGGAAPINALKRLVARSGEPVIRQAVRRAVKILGDQFVTGRTIKEALANTEALQGKGYRFSYDMLGEAARCEKDAERYFDRYMSAIEAVGRTAGPLKATHADALMGRPGLSVKLSALAPRFESGKDAHLDSVLKPRLLQLVRAARANGLPLTIDAEEQERLEPTLDMFLAAYRDEASAGWDGLGLAVQAYGRRAIPALRWLRRLAGIGGKRIPVRLVKGAYWDSEIKWAQERGLADYPVFTEKTNTDLSYLAGVRLLLSDPSAFFPQFATHNAYTIAAAHVAAANTPFEFQRLHGMGEALYEEVFGPEKLGRPVRIYAPVGGHEDLLAYLVRRLLENGANTSFVHQLADEAAPIAAIIRDPVEAAERVAEKGTPVSLMPRPLDVHGLERKAAAGLPLYDAATRTALRAELSGALAETFAAGPIIDGAITAGGDEAELVTCPHDRRVRIGSVVNAEPRHIEAALRSASEAAHDWSRTSAEARAAVLNHAANLFERERSKLMAVVVREAGKTLDNALGDVREAVDFLRYYALEAVRQLPGPRELKGVTGERNTIELVGRGPVLAISPWNFPLAIFTGQVAAALAAGNPVIAKPAPQTPVTATLAVKLLIEAGVPANVLHLLPGGGQVGAALVKDERIRAVLFTGSNDTAFAINRALAERRRGFIPFVAETGGINAMIADSSALPEQVVRDCIRSAFDSAGQRCSAARVLFVQNETADRTIEMLTGAIASLHVGDPLEYATDIGPVIDEEAQDALEAHKIRMQAEARELIDPRLAPELRVGTYVTPAAYEIDSLDQLERETFGPILHVVRYAQGHLDAVVAAINSLGYGLTLGLHSRIAAVADYVAEHARVGNLYVNRNQIGAVVGVQPFGGEGLSGTGPKAGGPGYLARLVTERVRSDDITATGGNVQLLGLRGQTGE
jgi:RHH-type proline utilization regulon transcriptional repressor/proline dehydrogenase/delta 1-pyrroline-5-carboxylate dehydrogenase